MDEAGDSGQRGELPQAGGVSGNSYPKLESLPVKQWWPLPLLNLHPRGPDQSFEVPPHLSPAPEPSVASDLLSRSVPTHSFPRPSQIRDEGGTLFPPLPPPQASTTESWGAPIFQLWEENVSFPTP